MYFEIKNDKENNNKFGELVRKKLIGREKNSSLLAASTSQKTTGLKDITFKSDTWGANVPVKSNLENIHREADWVMHLSKLDIKCSKGQ